MKKLRNLRIILIVILILACIFRYINSQTTLFLDTTNQAPEGYLSIADYEILDSYDHSVIEKLNRFDYDGYYMFYDYDESAETTRGIRCNSSWEDFVKAYGKYRALYIGYSKVHPNDDFDDYDSDYLDWITVEDFNEKYIQTGKINLEDYNIDVCFEAIVKNSKVYYTKVTQDKATNYNGLKLSMIHVFDLSFRYLCPNDFYNDAGKGVFDTISSNHFSY